MNSGTKQALDVFIDEVVQLAVGTVHMIGQEQATKVANAAFDLKKALNEDSTITESR